MSLRWTDSVRMMRSLMPNIGKWNRKRQIFKASYDWRKPIRSVGDTGQLSHRNSAPGRLAKVDRLFEKTCYAKEIDEMAAALVESFISHLNSRDDLEKAAVTVAEGIKDYSTGKRGR